MIHNDDKDDDKDDTVVNLPSNMIMIATVSILNMTIEGKEKNNVGENSIE